MKKISVVFAILFALSISVFFTGCNDKYDKLKMYLDSETNYVQLIMDDEYWGASEVSEEQITNKDAKTLKVVFDGIKKKHIGDLDIKVIPSDLAEVKENEVIDKTLYFNIYASRPGIGDIQVTHLSSGKSITIRLYVDKKAYSATSKENGIVLNFPEKDESGNDQEYFYTINPNDVLNYAPFDATDNVSWQIVGKTKNDIQVGVFGDNNEESPKLTQQIKITSKNAVEETFYITPTLTVSGYENIVLTDVKVPVTVLRVVDDTNIRVLSSNAVTTTKETEKIDNTTYKVVSEPITLFHNSLECSSAKLYLYTHEDTNLLASENYMKFYDYSINKTSQIDVRVNTLDNCIDVYGLDYNANTQMFEIIFTPKNCVGDIKSFTIRQEVLLSEVAEKITISTDGEDLTASDVNSNTRSVDINLLDYYAKNNGLGEKFNFGIYKSSTHPSLKNIRIVIDTDLLYSEKTETNNNNTYVEHVGDNSYLLLFYKGGEVLKFNKNTTTGKSYSEWFSLSSNIYIKYQYNSEGTESKDLSFIVRNEYDNENENYFGECEALENSTKNLVVNINRGRGIKSMSLYGAYVKGDSENESGHTSTTNAQNSIYVLNSAIADSTFFNNNSINLDTYVYGARIDEIEGMTAISTDEISDINFECTVYQNGEKVNLFDFAIYYSNLDSIRFIEGNTFNLNTKSSGDFYSVLLIIKKDGVTIPNGEYEIEISEPIGGYKSIFYYKVVTNVTVDNADITPFNSDDIVSYDEIYSATDYRNYLFNNFDDEFVSGLTAEQKGYLDSYLNNIYIVPTAKDISTSVRLGSYDENLNFVVDNTYIPYVKDITVSTTPVSLVYQEESSTFVENETTLLSNVKYVANNRDNIVGAFSFDIKLHTNEYGTVYNGVKNFIKVSYKLYSDKFELTDGFYKNTGANEPAEISFYFFIYVELGETKFENDASIINTYFYEDLGYYFQDEGRNTLTISLPNKYGKSQSMFDYVNYAWSIADEDKADFDYTENGNSLTFTLNKNSTNYRDRIIKAEITQFGVKRTLVSTIHVHKVNLTEKIVVRNSLNYLDGNGSYYIYLKEGGEFKFEVEQIGSPTFEGIKYVVCDLGGNVSDDYKIDDNGNLIKISENNTSVKDLKVLIFARDWARTNLDSKVNVFDFNNLSSYTIQSGTIDYSKRVEIIDIKIRDGSQNNPYLITNANDFKDISNNLNAYYEIVNDINLNGETKNLGIFNGSLTSYKDYKMLSSKPNDWETSYKNYFTYSKLNGFEPITDDTAPTFVYRKFYKLNQNVYTVYNIAFNTYNGFNLIDEISKDAVISNINFRFNFNNAYSKVGYIGLIAKNYGTIKNVKVEYSGNLTIEPFVNTAGTMSTPIYVGMLVAQNYGDIIFDNANTAYSTGSLSIKDSTTQSVYIGGLVGENTNLISGVLLNSNTSIEYALYYENQGSLFDGTIILTSTNIDAVLGGVTGLNTGKIKNVFTSGKLVGYNNLGGLIGKNINIKLNELATEENASIVNCLSTTQITGNDYIGGITGNDGNGSYYHVYYEVYNNENKVSNEAYVIKGNNYVGGLIGYGTLTQLNYCYFHSFRWDYGFVDPDETTSYTFEESEFYNELPDIYAMSNVGGLIGYANSNGNENNEAEITTDSAVYITNSAVDAYILANDFLGGLVGYAYGYPIATNIYVQGAFISEDYAYEDINVYKSDTKQSGVCKTNYYTYVFGVTYNDINDSYSLQFITEDKIGNSITNSLFKEFVLDTDNNINNGRYYIEFGGKPLITQAPTSINLDDALITILDRSTNIFNSNNVSDPNSKEKDKILIYYYNLINNNQSNYANDSVDINIINLDDIVNKSEINVTPNGVGARIKVTSSNEQVIVVSASGYIKLVGEGECVLTFASLINPSVFDTITVIVRSMPSDYNIYKNSSKNENLNNGTISIVKGESKFIYESYVGEITWNGTKYLYNTTNDVIVFAEISNNDGKISINGKSYDEENVQYSFEGKEPIIISVEEYSEETYTLTMTSYVKFNLGKDVYYVKVLEESETREFNIITKHGVTEIKTNVTDAVMSVADELNISLNLKTDTFENIVNIDIDVRDQNGNTKSVLDNDGNVIEQDCLFTYNNENRTSFKIEAGKIEEFVLKLNQNVRIEQDLFVTITFSSNKVKTEICLTLVPQKISSVVANAYKEYDGSWKSGSVIRPGQPTMIVIDIAPDTAYFEYLEITDSYSNEKISFTQWSEFDANASGLTGNGEALNELDKPSSDGFGIRLVKQKDKKSFYVYALLSTYATNNDAHTIVITAYSSSGYVLGSSSINLEVMLFPTVILSYYNENDVVEISVDSRDEIQTKETDLAVGVSAKIAVTTYNTIGNIIWTITGEESKNLSMQLSNNGYWYLTYSQNMTAGQIENLVGKTLNVKATVKQVIKGFEEEDYAILKFNLKRFTLNGISAQTARQTSGNRLGGIINEETYLEFYFDNIYNKDISYYQNGEYFNKNYFVDFNETKDVINEILKEVNNFNTSDNVTLKFVHNQTGEEINISDALKDKEISNKFYTVTKVDNSYLFKVGDVDLFKIVKNNNELTKLTIYSNSMNNYSLQVSVNYHYNQSGNVVLGADSNKEVETLVLTTNYGLNFIINSSPKDYYPIKNSEEFMNMVEGQYYILKNDITLKNYQMLDLALGGFDGNGYTITIDSFDYDSLFSKANGTTGYLGLFKQIYEGEIIENLTVEYKYYYAYDLSQHFASDNTDYTEFYFGGIAPLNSGIITNCVVEGKVNLTTSKISPANFYLGGIVSENSSTGYITNSTAKLAIDAGGIIGGIATKNEGKIVSTNFLGSVKAYTSTNTSLSNEINAACFVVTNSGEISMCYVAKDDSISNSGVINSGGSLGGFVYNNSGNIYDCYLKNVEFSSRGYMGGFVYSSTGTIERCYVHSVSSLQGDRYVDIFVYDKTSGTFKDCFYILKEKLNSTVKGIECITELDMLKESHYTNFAFSINGYNVWLMTESGAVLSNCGALQYQKTITTTIENGVEKIEYSILGTKENPYVIYDTQSFTDWFSRNENGVVYGYFRFVSDIDFSSVKDVLVSTRSVFSGTIEGNNMTLSNFSLFTSKDEPQSSIGLFKEIRHTSKRNYINNLTLNCTSVRASTSTAVGVLAGIIDGGYIYNVSIDNPDLVVLGRNAVGGLAGIIKGDFIVENITSNVSVNASFRQTIMSKLNIYNGRYNTGADSSNIEQVSYAGSITGIVEGYDSRINSSVSINNYYTIRNSKVLGNIVLIGETVGGAFGYVSERARISNVTFEVGDNATLKGVYYAGGLIGENRGIIDNSKVIATKTNVTLFDAELNGSFATCNGGISAVNYGGLIYNCENNVNVVNMYTLSTVGGITGRNVEGSINNCVNNGIVYGFFAGNIAGSDYTYSTINKAGNSIGAITSDTILALNKTRDYSNIDFGDGVNIKNGYVVTLENLDEWYSTQKSNLALINKYISNFYKYDDSEFVTLSFSRILGAVIGITDKNLTYNTANLTINNGENVFIQINNSIEEFNFVDNFASTAKTLGETEKYSELQAGIKDNSIADFYYLVPAINSSYDFYNLTEKGYSDAYARVIY